MLKRWLILCSGTFFFSLSAWCADISGIWTGTLPDRTGAQSDVSFRFVQEGEKLTGKIYGDNESTPIDGAKLAGDQITFTIGSELNGQNNKFVYTGTIKDGEIEMTRERTVSKGDAGKPAPKQVFRLRRLA